MNMNRTLLFVLAVSILLAVSVSGFQILSTTTRNVVTVINNTDCKPSCMNLGSYAEGWYYSCNKSFIKYAKCRYCNLACMNPRNIYEGLYDSCTGLPVVYNDCNKTVARTTTTKPTTTVATSRISTTSTTLTECYPVCLRKTPQLKGWFNSCTGNLIRQASCSSCNPVCLSNKKTEGWYDGCNSKFIMAAYC
jgi:hypothetical protein